MSQEKTKKSLLNWDLVTVNPNNENWDWKDLFCFWGVNIQSVIGFSLIASLYLIYNLNSFVVFFWYNIWININLFFFKFNRKTISKIWFTICCHVKIIFGF